MKFLNAFLPLGQVLLLAAFFAKAPAAWAQPANDAPCNATAITVGSTCSYANYSVASATNSTAGNTTCGNGNSDVWFKFVAPASGAVSIRTQAGSDSSGLQDGAMAVYSACSSPFGYIACNADYSGSDDMPRMDLTCLTSGQTYFVRFWKQNGTGSRVNFGFCISSTASTPMTNDEPCSAQSLPVGGSCSNTLASNYCATNSAVANASCADYEGGDVWFTLVVPASGAVRITTSTAASNSLTNTGMAVYTAANCSTPGGFTALACEGGGNGNMAQVSMSCLTPGTTLYARVWDEGNNDRGQFNICAVDLFPNAAPANDEPCGATPLTVITGSSCGTPTSGTTVNARPSCSLAATGCGGDANSRDVWFSFVAPPSGIVLVESTLGTLTDGLMAMYQASSCAGPLQEIACDNDGGPGAAPFISYIHLVPGSTYYLRYWGATTTTGTFTLCLRTLAVPATTCGYLLEMFDSNENGWGASAVQVSVDGGAYTPYTVTAAYNVVIFGVNPGGSIRFRYAVNGAGSQNQNRYLIRHFPSAVPVFQSGPTPAPVSPTVAFQVDPVTCTTPTADPHDCNGSITVCGSAGIQNGTVGSGFTQDLSDSNRGCLSGERQGTWYIFSPSSSGSFGFTIVPAGNADYDFAVWGPYVNPPCPPDGPPIRCSYAAPSSANTYNTGLGNGATDFSEGAGGNGFVAPLNATANQIYVLYIDNYSTNGQQFNLNWNFGPGSALDCGVVLPVELLTLRADPAGVGVDVTWATASEHNSSHFLVQRSADNMNFSTIGRINSAGDSQQRINYAFTDDVPYSGANYYRLEQVDHDGSSTISHTVVVLFGKTGSAPLLFPNPAKDLLHVAFENPMEGYALIYVRDALGRTMDASATLIERGQRTVDLPTDRLAPGYYTVRIALATGEYVNGGGFLKQ